MKKWHIWGELNWLKGSHLWNSPSGTHRAELSERCVVHAISFFYYNYLGFLIMNIFLCTLELGFFQMNFLVYLQPV